MLMSDTFPLPITSLPEADIPIKGLKAYISQSNNHQIVFMEFAEETLVPEHSHESQWEIVLEGRVEVSMDGAKQVYSKGDRFFIPNEAKHSARVFAGYTAFAFFNQADRYKAKR
jgi:quercetin dioxygenase-like cupin family protein